MTWEDIQSRVHDITQVLSKNNIPHWDFQLALEVNVNQQQKRPGAESEDQPPSKRRAAVAKEVITPAAVSDALASAAQPQAMIAAADEQGQAALDAIERLSIEIPPVPGENQIPLVSLPAAQVSATTGPADPRIALADQGALAPESYFLLYMNQLNVVNQSFVQSNAIDPNFLFEIGNSAFFPEYCSVENYKFQLENDRILWVPPPSGYIFKTTRNIRIAAWDVKVQIINGRVWPLLAEPENSIVLNFWKPASYSNSKQFIDGDGFPPPEPRYGMTIETIKNNQKERSNWIDMLKARARRSNRATVRLAAGLGGGRRHVPAVQVAQPAAAAAVPPDYLNKIAELTAELAAAKAVQSIQGTEIDKFQKNLSNKDEEIVKLKDELSQVHRQRAEEHGRCQLLREEVKRLKDEVDSLVKSRERLQSDLNQAEPKAELLRIRANEAEKQLGVSHHQVEELSAQVGRLEKANKEINQKLQAEASEVVRHKGIIEGLNLKK